MQISTTRFGNIQAKDSDILTFPEGIVGFSKLRQFIMVDDPTDEIFSWLQSCESPAIAFPILDPNVVYKNYKLNLNRVEKEVIGATGTDKLKLFLICTIPADVTQMTANLKAPIVLNLRNQNAKQIVAQENDYPIKFPIFNELRLRMSQPAEAPIKSVATNFDSIVRIGGNQVPQTTLDV